MPATKSCHLYTVEYQVNTSADNGLGSLREALELTGKSRRGKNIIISSPDIKIDSPLSYAGSYAGIILLIFHS